MKNINIIFEIKCITNGCYNQTQGQHFTLEGTTLPAIFLHFRFSTTFLNTGT